MNKENKSGPCLNKNCSFCCNPVKMDTRVLRSGFVLPTNLKGEQLWTPTGEIIASEEKFEKERIATFVCKNFNEQDGKCFDYENRPNVCRNTSCIKDESGDIDAQHKAMTEVSFIKLR